MPTLTEEEVMDLLRKLGLESSSEINSYFADYRDYLDNSGGAQNLPGEPSNK